MTLSFINQICGLGKLKLILMPVCKHFQMWRIFHSIYFSGVTALDLLGVAKSFLHLGDGTASLFS